MKTVGLTGGIGTGKSTAATYLMTKGFGLIDADEIGRELTAKGSSVLDILDAIFGPDGELGTGEEILDEDGNLKRDVMASIVFAEQERIDCLNEIMFEAIINEIKERIEEYQNPAGHIHLLGTTAILIDAPLLFESGLDKLCDHTILITADLETRIERVCERNHVSREDVEARIRRQLSDDEKRQLADFIVDNSGIREELYAQLDQLLPQLLKS